MPLGKGDVSDGQSFVEGEDDGTGRAARRRYAYADRTWSARRGNGESL